MGEGIEKLYTVREAAAILKRSRQTIFAYINGGLLPARKLKPGASNSKFVITESDLKAFIENGVPAGYYQKLYPRPHRRKGKKDKE